MIDIQQYFDNMYRGSKNQSLQTIKYLLGKYDNFHKNMKFIHVAGTNGKGSCVEIINNILLKQEYKVGKFISPHLIRYNERIVVNNKEITDKEMSDLIQEIEPIMNEYNKNNDLKVSYFELLLLIALLYFDRKKVDFVILEAGLGGLYDATNIIEKPLVSVITSIGYDHIALLGNTLEEITNQKAGIIKEDSNTIFFEQTEKINKIIKDKCIEKNNKLHLIKRDKDQNYRYDLKYQYFDYKEYENLELILKGEKQIQNAGLCVECMKILNKLGFNISEKSVREGLKTVIHKARMETLNQNPLIIFDGAHNTVAIENLQSNINKYYKDYNRIYIVSILERKDYKKILELLLKDKEAKFVFTSGINYKKYATKEQLYNEAIKHTNNTNLYMKNLNEAIEDLFKEKDKKTVNFVVGSLYTYEYVTETIEKQK